MAGPIRSSEVLRYPPTNWMLMSFIEKGESSLNFARRPASMDEWAGLLSPSLRLDVFGGDDHYLQIADKRYLFTGQNCPDQTGQNDFEVREGKALGCFVLSLDRKQYLC